MLARRGHLLSTIITCMTQFLLYKCATYIRKIFMKYVISIYKGKTIHRICQKNETYIYIYIYMYIYIEGIEANSIK